MSAHGSCNLRLARRVQRWVGAFRSYLRILNGDAAYARYLRHWQAHSPRESPLDRGQFFQAELERRWNTIRRCC
ncbi:MAG: YbdD/YjiX family protein [Gammaproteobacteria bacterium]|nr:YbdD/YjiX family protein [Gammaproteobacteria bacterium]